MKKKTSYKAMKRHGYYQVKEADVKILHNMWLLCRRQNCIERKMSVVWCQGFDEGMSKWSIEGFSGSENTLYDTIMIDSYHFIFIQIHRMYNTKGESYCKLWPSDECDMSM